jgi:hypothetical protein
MNNYYVYVYIDPRNYEEFYYGKGVGARKYSHLSDNNDSSKTKRINAIREAGLDPIIRVIAKNLSETEALLVEKTLLWKLGKHLTNISSGHYSEKFRPHNTMHKEISGFDYECGIYYYNVGEGTNRNWDDYRKYGFISGGQGKRWRDAMLGFNPGDIIAAYLKGYGFVGIGIICDNAKPINQVTIGNSAFDDCELQAPNMFENSNSLDTCEYIAIVNWIRTVSRAEAKKARRALGIYTTTHVRASLDSQPNTIKYLEESFDFKIKDYLT